MARLLKLNEEVKSRIVGAIRVGSTYELACYYAGISYQSLRNWIIRGEAELKRRDNERVQEDTEQWLKEQPFVELFEALKSAEGAAAVGWLATIEAAAKDGQWQAAAWKLERRYPADYNRNRTEWTGADGKDLEIKFVYPDKP